LKDEKYFREMYQQAGVASGLIEMTIPDKPKNRLQKYRLTLDGVKYLKEQDKKKE
jgi:ATP-dependent DNA helicase RecG